MKLQRTTYPFYNELIELFSGHIIPKVQTKRTGIAAPAELEKIQQDVINTIKKNKNALDEIEGSILKLLQYHVYLFPQIYVARTKDIKTDIEYFTAKTFWPLEGGKRKEVKIYLGKAEDFNNDTKSPKAMKVAHVKMKLTIARRMKEGSL